MAVFGHPECAVVDILPSEEYQEGNPFEATLVTEDFFKVGEIRITPPFNPGFIVGLNNEHDGNVVLDHKLTTNEATILDFSVNKGGFDEGENVKVYDDMPSPVYVTQYLLTCLGQAANKELFTKHYRNKIQKPKIQLVTDN